MVQSAPGNTKVLCQQVCHLQVEGGQESLLEWAPFSIELVNSGNESQLVANVCASCLPAFVLALWTQTAFS